VCDQQEVLTVTWNSLC